MTRWQQIARETVGADYAEQYAERFRAMAARGEDVHGEATFVAGLVDPPARVLDAGCGTGRVAIRLAELGYDVVGVDVDASMLLQAREEAPELDWRVGDLADLDTGRALRRRAGRRQHHPAARARHARRSRARTWPPSSTRAACWSAASVSMTPTCPAAARSPRSPTSTRRSPPPASSRVDAVLDVGPRAVRRERPDTSSTVPAPRSLTSGCTRI